MMTEQQVIDLCDEWAKLEEQRRLAGDYEMSDIYWGGLVALAKVLRGES